METLKTQKHEIQHFFCSPSVLVHFQFQPNQNRGLLFAIYLLFKASVTLSNVLMFWKRNNDYSEEFSSVEKILMMHFVLRVDSGSIRN